MKTWWAENSYSNSLRWKEKRLLIRTEKNLFVYYFKFLTVSCTLRNLFQERLGSTWIEILNLWGLRSLIRLSSFSCFCFRFSCFFFLLSLMNSTILTINWKSIIAAFTPTTAQLNISLTWYEPEFSRKCITRNSMFMMINPISVPIVVILIAAVLNTFLGRAIKIVITFNTIKTLSWMIVHFLRSCNASIIIRLDDKVQKVINRPK